MKIFKVISNSLGISLAEIMVSIGLLGGVSLAVMQLMKSTANINKQALSAADQAEFKSMVRTIISNPNFCRISFAGEGPSGSPTNPVTFRKTDIDEDTEGLPIALFLSDQTGEIRTTKKLNGADNPDTEDLSKYGALKINTLNLIMNNGTGTDYSNSPSHSDIGTLRAKIEKKVGKTTRELTVDFEVNITMSTGQSPESSGESRILSCELGSAAGSSASIDYTSCQDLIHTEGFAVGATCGVEVINSADGSCESFPNHVLVAFKSGLRFPGACVASHTKCCLIK